MKMIFLGQLAILVTLNAILLTICDNVWLIRIGVAGSFLFVVFAWTHWHDDRREGGDSA